uniref:Uncharacterized protein n=1 Tax=Haemonchus contortus TaxID=6289 RepID=A0A7I5E6L2_HAECO
MASMKRRPSLQQRTIHERNDRPSVQQRLSRVGRLPRRIAVDAECVLSSKHTAVQMGTNARSSSSSSGRCSRFWKKAILVRIRGRQAFRSATRRTVPVGDVPSVSDYMGTRRHFAIPRDWDRHKTVKFANATAHCFFSINSSFLGKIGGIKLKGGRLLDRLDTLLKPRLRNPMFWPDLTDWYYY